MALSFLIWWQGGDGSGERNPGMGKGVGMGRLGMVLGTFQFEVNPSRIHLPDSKTPQLQHLLPSSISLGTGMGNGLWVVVDVGAVWVLVLDRALGPGRDF